MITKAEKELYYWHVGSFTKDNFHSILYTLIAKADSTNKFRLSMGFPEEVQAMKNFQNVEGYWEELQERIQE